MNLRNLATFALGHMIWGSGLVMSALGLHVQQRAFSLAKPTTLTPVLVSIEGNIGAGKTTLLKRLKSSHPEWEFIDEPVDTWSSIRNEKGESILEVFYKDRHRWSYTFQNCALLTRFQNIESAVAKARNSGKVGKHVFLTERCLDTDFHVFTKMLKEEGSIDKLELDLYIRWLHQLKATATPLSAIVHVNTEPSVCAERIKQRSRGGESAISMDYLENLNHHQTTWVDSADLPVFKTNLSDVSQVEGFIEKLTESVDDKVL